MNKQKEILERIKKINDAKPEKNNSTMTYLIVLGCIAILIGYHLT